MKLHKLSIETLFPLYSEWLNKPENYDLIKLPSSKSILFIAADFLKIPKELLNDLAKYFIKNGACYICLWGDDCDNAVFIFEDAALKIKPDFKFRCVSHMDETIKEAVEFSILNAAPDENLWPECSILLLSIGDFIGQLTLPVIANDINYSNKKDNDY